MTRLLTLIQMEEGQFISDWQYSQGFFDYSITPDLLQAENFSDSDILNRWLPLFESKGGKVRRFEVEIREL